MTLILLRLSNIADVRDDVWMPMIMRLSLILAATAWARQTTTHQTDN